MLMKLLSLSNFYVRKVKPKPLTKPEGVQSIKFSEQQLSRMGHAAYGARVSIGKAFQEKVKNKADSQSDQTGNRKIQTRQKKTAETRRQQLYNKQMPKPAQKHERFDPQQMSLQQLSSVRLNPQFLPVTYLKQAQKIFNKYGQARLREIAQNFSKLVSLRYSQQKLDYEQYKNLSFNRLQQKLPPQRQIPQIYLTTPQKILSQPPDRSQPVRKVDSQQFSPQLSYTQNITISYLLNRAPRTFSTAVRLMTEIKYKYPTFKPKGMIDFGAGLGAGACAFKDVFQIEDKRQGQGQGQAGQGNTEGVYCVEPASRMRKVGKYLTQGMGFKWFESLGEMASEVRDAQVVYAGYVINQLKSDLVEVYLEALYAKVKNEGFLVVAEYGNPFGARLIHQVREWAIKKNMYIAAPCPHHLKCPLARSKSWCHFDQPSGIYPQNVFGKLPTDQAIKYQKYSYIILQKKQPDQSLSSLQKHEPNITKQWDRVIFPIMKRGKHVVFDLCTKKGLFQRRISAKSHGPEYKQARKLRWGDYWRFGKRIPHKFRKQRKTGRRLW